ncbi:plexin-A4-like [Ptychodera flava]|uniref:plexin-A4-like n=1 Tax=Ptychodera flava TaxID=63121 RepID=UPI003969F12F
MLFINVAIFFFCAHGEVKDNLDRLFSELLTMERQQNYLFPPPIKYMFDYLDTLAADYGRGDPNEAFTWKADCLMSTLWIKMIRCPQYVLDINPSEGLLATFDIAATMFTDICSATKKSLEDENKGHILMFRPTLLTYFEDVKCLPNIDDFAFGKFLKSNYQELEDKLDGNSSLCELLKYVIPCKDKVADALERNEHCKKKNHAAKLEEVMSSFSVHDYEQIPSQYITLQPKPNNVYERLHCQPVERITVPGTEQTKGSLEELSSGEPAQQYQTLRPVQHPEYSTLHIGPMQSIVASENNGPSNKKNHATREDEVPITVRSTDYEMTTSNYTELKPKPISIYEKLDLRSGEETIRSTEQQSGLQRDLIGEDTP